MSQLITRLNIKDASLDICLSFFRFFPKTLIEMGFTQTFDAIFHVRLAKTMAWFRMVTSAKGCGQVLYYMSVCMYIYKEEGIGEIVDGPILVCMFVYAFWKNTGLSGVDMRVHTHTHTDVWEKASKTKACLFLTLSEAHPPRAKQEKQSPLTVRYALVHALVKECNPHSQGVCAHLWCVFVYLFAFICMRAQVYK